MSVDFLALSLCFNWFWWFWLFMQSIRDHNDQKMWFSNTILAVTVLFLFGLDFFTKTTIYEKTPKSYTVSVGEDSIAYIEDHISSEKVNLNKHLDRNFKDGEQVLLRRTKDYVWYGPIFKSQELSFKESK